MITSLVPLSTFSSLYIVHCASHMIWHKWNPPQQRFLLVNNCLLIINAIRLPLTPLHSPLDSFFQTRCCTLSKYVIVILMRRLWFLGRSYCMTDLYCCIVAAGWKTGQCKPISPGYTVVVTNIDPDKSFILVSGRKSFTLQWGEKSSGGPNPRRFHSSSLQMGLFKEYFTCFKKGLSHFTQAVLSNWLYVLYRLYLLGKRLTPPRSAVVMALITKLCF